MAVSDAELKIVSLVRYSDACDPASRHRDCPYAVDRDGELTCGEECRDLLASLLRRGRAPSESKAQAFDARQLRLSETGITPGILWHTSSLLQTVVKVTRTHPLRADGSHNLRRHVDATSALGALGCRGLDPEKLVRRGLAETIKLRLSGWLETLETSDEPRNSDTQLHRWRAFFRKDADESVAPGEYIAAALSGPCARRLDTWLETAPLEDLLRWTPPETGLDSPPPATAGQESEFWTWIVERFTQTYLGRWSLESLKREYKFLRGSWKPDVPAEIMDERILSQEQVATELAERAVVTDDAIDPATMLSLTVQAVDLLEMGQRRAAAALMDGARRLKPSDLMLQQNYAFCFLPDEPARARAVFKDLLAKKIENFRAVTLCNLALAESLLGNTGAALRAGEDALQAIPEGRTAYLWVGGVGNWRIELTSMRQWCVYFGAELEKSQGVTGGAWAERLGNLNLVEPPGSSANPSSADKGEADL